MKEQCKKLRVGLFGDVASRDVSYMERVNNIIDTTGWKSQHKAPNMLKTFIKVVASCITPFDVRDRVKEKMKTVQASTLRGRDWDEKGQRTGKNEQYQREAYYQNGNVPRPKGGYTKPARWNVDMTDLLVLMERQEGRRRTSMGPQRQRGVRLKIVNSPESEPSMAPAKTTVERYTSSANNRDTGKNAVKRFKYKQRKAELKAKRAVKAVKAKIAEDDRE
ncbi:hypothetical protein H257_14661 [Aphanomyces astaci]|uniref:Uncharacterized protein n=1 Tax=Aphanomyces astaci TaxID=112090 RepID=W4FSP3_APHAT|nr:hypothetical protein H257_14661 [Aphanomyces astaci]ETV69638.1 hypothetical protein H257_14661 [Aphanomyces astaci]|eukprot:XP_009840854.1 hypothetical protein H257_14661 [Aphanomyces astaci]